MGDKKKSTVEFSAQSLQNATDIVCYLQERFSEKEVDQFYQILRDFEEIVSLYPTLYSEYPKLKIRRAVLTKVLSVIYKIKRNKVFIVAILDNRWVERVKL